MVYYYRNSWPMYATMVVFAKTTVFSLVIWRGEFWFFVILHICFVVFAKEYNGLAVVDLTWEGVASTNFFLTFLITFFNGHCYNRYLQMYAHSMRIIDQLVLFVHEVVVTLAHSGLESERILTTKYALAIAYIHFMCLANGTVTPSGWREIVQKGLLTANEVDQLTLLPLRSTDMAQVVAGWALQAFDEALNHDSLWTIGSMRIVHAHNRADTCITKALRACWETRTLISLPIPFPYFHLLNVALIFNAFAIGCVASFFQTYLTVVPYTMSLLMFFGLREISCAMADPYGTDDVDFPIPAFLDYIFDTCVVLLETFRNAEACDVARMLASSRSFRDSQVRRQTKHEIIYESDYDCGSENAFIWNKEMPIVAIAGSEQYAAAYLRAAARVGPPPEDTDIRFVAQDETDSDDENLFEICRRCLLGCTGVCRLLRGLCRAKIEAPEEEPPPPTPQEILKHDLEELRRHKEVLTHKVKKAETSVDALKEEVKKVRKRRHRRHVVAGDQSHELGDSSLGVSTLAEQDLTASAMFESFTDARQIVRAAMSVHVQPRHPDEGLVGQAVAAKALSTSKGHQGSHDRHAGVVK